MMLTQKDLENIKEIIEKVESARPKDISYYWENPLLGKQALVNALKKAYDRIDFAINDTTKLRSSKDLSKSEIKRILSGKERFIDLSREMRVSYPTLEYVRAKYKKIIESKRKNK